MAIDLDNISFSGLLEGSPEDLIVDLDTNVDEDTDNNTSDVKTVDEDFSLEDFFGDRTKPVDEKTTEEDDVVPETDEVNDEITAITDDSNENMLSVFASELRENGLLPDIEDAELKGVNNFEDLLGVVSKQLETVQVHWQNEYKKNILKNLIAEGIVKADQVNFKDADNRIFTEADINDSEDAAKELLQEYYKMKGLPDRRIKKLVDESVDLQDDALDIFDDYKALVSEKENEISKRLEAREKEEMAMKQQLENKIKESTYGYKEFIPGQKVNDRLKKEVHESIPAVLQKINSDLGKYAPIIAYLDKYGLLDGDFSKVVKVKETEAVNKFTAMLNNRGGGVSPSSSDLKKTAFESLNRTKR